MFYHSFGGWFSFAANILGQESNCDLIENLVTGNNHTPSSYYAVIFSNRHTGVDEGYAETATAMEDLAKTMPGYIGFESARNKDGTGIAVWYWESEEAIANWKKQTEHLVAQKRGREEWYSEYTVRIARVERAYSMNDR